MGGRELRWGGLQTRALQAGQSWRSHPALCPEVRGRRKGCVTREGVGGMKEVSSPVNWDEVVVEVVSCQGGEEDSHRGAGGGEGDSSCAERGDEEIR